MQPLTEQEKQFAEKNYGLVYSFLHRYKYSVDDFYDIVIFGFLKAVQVYHRKEDVKRKYDFAFISWQYMRSEIGNHFRMESALKRKMETATISLDICGTGYSLEDSYIEKIITEETEINSEAEDTTASENVEQDTVITETGAVPEKSTTEGVIEENTSENEMHKETESEETEHEVETKAEESEPDIASPSNATAI